MQGHRRGFLGRNVEVGGMIGLIPQLLTTLDRPSQTPLIHHIPKYIVHRSAWKSSQQVLDQTDPHGQKASNIPMRNFRIILRSSSIVKESTVLRAPGRGIVANLVLHHTSRHHATGLDHQYNTTQRGFTRTDNYSGNTHHESLRVFDYVIRTAIRVGTARQNH